MDEVSQKEFSINKIHFTWQYIYRHQDVVVTVNNPLYGTVERRVEPGISGRELAHDLAIELLRKGPLSARDVSQS